MYKNLNSSNFLIHKFEEAKEELRRILENPNFNEKKMTEVLKRQHHLKRSLLQFLKIELGQETIFQTTG